MSLNRADRNLFAYSSLRSSAEPIVPQELVDLILRCLTSTSGSDDITLRNCALVCRAWAHSSQRVLFRCVRVSGYPDLRRLLSCFRSSPHLAAFTRDITVSAKNRDHYDEPYPTAVYVACLDALFSLLTNVTLVEATFGPNVWPDDEGAYHEVNQPFLTSISTFIHTSPVTELILSGPCESTTFSTLGGLLKEGGIQRLTLDVWNPFCFIYTVTETLSFPSVEFLRLGFHLSHMWEEVCVWSSYLPNLKCFEVSVDDGLRLPSTLNTWCKILDEGKFPTVKLESFTFEFLSSYQPEIDKNWAVLPLNYIHSHHLFLTVRQDGEYPYMAGTNVLSVRTILLWWVATFREVVEVHCKELTFTVHLLDVEEVAEVWGMVDEVLSRDVYRDVHRIHFENWEGDRITETSYPNDAANIRLVLPRLAQRGVLSFR
ncbi:hypothetical protein BDZ89DRAFT_1059999 [Hymenopellis radicata]|nr:hypothetical protein BDZ89DRAFT_1059999 [Hymenopellis radicata]